MKTPLTNLFILLILIFSPVILFAQAINTLSITPANPTPEDSVKVICTVWLPSGPCWVDNHFATFTQDTLIDITTTFNSGMLTVICNTADTSELGRLDPGTYHCTYVMKYVGLPLFADTASLSFTVSPLSGMSNPGPSDNAFKLTPGPVNGQVIVSFNLPKGVTPLNMKVFATDGRLLEEVKNIAGYNTFLVSLPGFHGICIFTLETSSPVTHYSSRKFFIP